MNAEIRPLSEVTQRATEILIREMGVADTLRFLNQFHVGSGDYVRERGDWLDGLSLEEIVSKIKAARKPNGNLPTS
jgi:hypothetical protein